MKQSNSRSMWRKNGGTQQDYNTWRANFGRTATSGANSHLPVPEPATLLLLFCTFLPTLGFRQRA